MTLLPATRFPAELFPAIVPVAFCTPNHGIIQNLRGPQGEIFRVMSPPSAEEIAEDFQEV